MMIVALIALVAIGVLFVRGRSALHDGSAPPITKPGAIESREASGLQDAASISTAGPSTTTSTQGAPKYNAAVVEELNRLKLADQLPELREKAKRDPSLAYALAKALGQCALADSAYAALSAGAGRMGGVEKAQARMEEYEQKFAKCEGLDGKNLALRYELARSAASAGLLEAQIDYRTLAAEYVMSEAVLQKPGIAREYHDNAVSFTTRAAQTGHPDALMGAFRLYSDGMLIPANHVVAYRYLRAYAQANPSPTALKSLADFGARLSPQELRQATAP